jgi:hypothetical protein
MLLFVLFGRVTMMLNVYTLLFETLMLPCCIALLFLKLLNLVSNLHDLRLMLIA